MANLAFSPRGTVLSYQTNPSVGFIPIIQMRDINFTGAKFDLADVTNYQSGIFKAWLTTLADSGEMSFTGQYVPTDSSQQALLGFFNNGTLVQWKVQLPNQIGTITFSAYVQSLEHGLPIDKEGTITGKLKITGAVLGF